MFVVLPLAVAVGIAAFAGHVSQAMRNGATLEEVMAQTGHTTASTVLRYRRENAPLVGNSVTKLGL